MNAGGDDPRGADAPGRADDGPATSMVLPPRLTDSARSLRDTARARGIRTVQLPDFTLPPGLRAQHLHAGPGFADAVADDLGIALLEAPADWLATLPVEFTRLLAGCAHTLPTAIVVDIGTTDGDGWAVIEANAAWASGRYTADPDAALDVVLRAAAPAAQLTPRDRPFVRPAARVTSAGRTGLT